MSAVRVAVENQQEKIYKATADIETAVQQIREGQTKAQRTTDLSTTPDPAELIPITRPPLLAWRFPGWTSSSASSSLDV